MSSISLSICLVKHTPNSSLYSAGCIPSGFKKDIESPTWRDISRTPPPPQQKPKVVNQYHKQLRV